MGVCILRGGNGRVVRSQGCGYFFRAFRDGLCESALPAADLEVLLVRPSRSVFDAADAALLEVTFFGAFRCDSALPAEDFDVRPVDFPRNVLEALLAAGFLVVLLFAILHLLFVQSHHQLLLRGPARRACWARQHTHLRDSGI